MLKQIRSWLNVTFGIPIVGFLRTWILNVIIGNVPWAVVRNFYYRKVCRISIGENTEIWSGVRFAGGAMDKISTVSYTHLTLPTIYSV